jgi:hypothetical protein
MEVSDELKRLWEEVIVVYFKVDYTIPAFPLRECGLSYNHFRAFSLSCTAICTRTRPGGSKWMRLELSLFLVLPYVPEHVHVAQYRSD